MKEDFEKELADIKKRVGKLEARLKDPEGELSDYASKQLVRSKSRSRSEYIKLS